MNSQLISLPGQGLIQTYCLPPICVVGEQLMKGVGTWAEGALFDYNVRGCHLFLSYEHPAESELKAFSDTARFALFRKYGTIFLLFKFGDMPWQDAPYSFWLVPEEGRPDPEADMNRPGNRLFLHCFLVNAATGILEGIRALTLSPEFTTQLLQSVKDQMQNPSSAEEHARAVAQIYDQYPAPKAMVREALVKCRGGD